ncbi:MAG: hypothetical protein JO063_06200 [Pseudonocardiales bacterium]|nr:hypothetical protein [Pseudonocardiales bacterium]MBV9031769.1 hypothetical protein [Pseudonocardiales bacterium]MBW0009695.1 hypothetical protein [Pseudonocardiales bacterium]
MAQWNGYVEHHDMIDADRKLDGRHARLAREPEITLSSPEEVGNWISRKLVELARLADADAQMKNKLMTHPDNVYRSAAKQGRSVYTSVHVTRTEVFDVCAELEEPANF